MATWEQETTSKAAGITTSLTVTSPGGVSGNGLSIVVMAAQRNLAYTISSPSGHTWTLVRDGSVGGQIGGLTVSVWSTPVTTGGAPSLTATWPVGGAAGHMQLMHFAIVGATAVHDGDEDTETQTEAGAALTLTSDLVDEGFDVTTAEVIVSMGRETPIGVGTNQDFSDFMHTYDARFTEGAVVSNISDAGAGQRSYIQAMYDLGGSGCEAESVSATTNNVAGTAEVRYASIRLLFDRVARGSGGWSWHNGEPRWQVVRGM